ncbi:MAG: calcium/sodium antiporter [Lentisphaerae bacterium]|nr:calcium/sodium antiporter [Lentisphaerota bacterium]
MQTFYQIAGGIAGIALLYYGAEFLIKGGVSIALKLKVPSLIIGLTLVAFGTSAPELVVSIDAALKGSGDISIGNVVGSNICNIALILGLSAAIAPLTVQKKLLRFDLPLLTAASIFVVLFCFLSRGITRWQGGIFFAGILAYTAYSIYSGKKDGSDGCDDEISSSKIYPYYLAAIFVIGGLLGLVAGAKLFVNAAIFIARAGGISDAVIGLTVVALGTSLPELATSVVAAVKGEQDIAIGNVIGSNMFNILCILGIAPLISPIHAPTIDLIDLGMMLFLTIALFPIMRTGWKINRAEGAFLLLIYCGYTAWLFIK